MNKRAKQLINRFFNQYYPKLMRKQAKNMKKYIKMHLNNSKRHQMKFHYSNSSNRKYSILSIMTNKYRP